MGWNRDDLSSAKVSLDDNDQSNEENLHHCSELLSPMNDDGETHRSQLFPICFKIH